MKDIDAKQFDELVSVTWEIYPKSLSAQARRLYWESLKRFSFADVKRAFSMHIQNPDNGQYPPKPADIIRLIAGSTQTASAIAWTKAIKAVKHIGPHRSVVFDDRVIHAVITDMGGWIKFCELEESAEPFVARDFERRYVGYAMRQDVKYPKQLIGISDAENQNQTFQRGKAVPQLAVFGDKDQARLVYQSGGESNQGLVHLVNLLPAPNEKRPAA